MSFERFFVNVEWLLDCGIIMEKVSIEKDRFFSRSLDDFFNHNPQNRYVSYDFENRVNSNFVDSQHYHLSTSF